MNRFAFVLHPLGVRDIQSDRRFRWTRHLPDALVESFAARLPPVWLSRITGARSPATGQGVEGYLIGLGATPRKMLALPPEVTYRRLGSAARMAQKRGARIMGLGAFTSVVGDAGETVARQAPIAITTGNSLTVAATLEAAEQATRRMGLEDPARCRAMVIGATGSIGKVCARMLARSVQDITLISIEPGKLEELQRAIEAECPGTTVRTGTEPKDLLEDRDLVITATSAFGQRILDISRCKPGAVICDVAKPPDINEAEAALRPDVLVIESGEVRIPGGIDFHYDIRLPDGVAYACLAETLLLAMDGRFENFTVGRELRIDRIEEIHGLYKKHGLQLAELRSLGREVTDSLLAEKRARSAELSRNLELLEQTKKEAGEKLARLPVVAKGVTTAANGRGRRPNGGLEALAYRLRNEKS